MFSLLLKTIEVKAIFDTFVTTMLKPLNLPEYLTSISARFWFSSHNYIVKQHTVNRAIYKM